MDSWKKQTFDLESKFKNLDAYYTGIAKKLSDRNAVLQYCLTTAHGALTQVMADADLPTAQTTASNAIAKMIEVLDAKPQV